MQQNTTQAQIREDQKVYGRQQSKDEGKTLSLSKSTSKRVASQSNSRGRQKPKGRKPGRVLDGHEQEIAHAVVGKSRATITLSGKDDVFYNGVIEKFDKYSVKMRFDNGQAVWIFKSSFESLSIEEANQASR